MILQAFYLPQMRIFVTQNRMSSTLFGYNKANKGKLSEIATRDATSTRFYRLLFSFLSRRFYFALFSLLFKQTEENQSTSKNPNRFDLYFPKTRSNQCILISIVYKRRSLICLAQRVQPVLQARIRKYVTVGKKDSCLPALLSGWEKISSLLYLSHARV